MFKPKIDPYEEKLAKSNAYSWRYSFVVIMKEIVTTISNLKQRLKSNQQFNDQDLPKLRQLYSQVQNLVKANEEKGNNDITEEIDLVQQILDIINSYGEQSKIFAGVQKRVTRTMMGSPVATVTNYYYQVGNDISYKSLRLKK